MLAVCNLATGILFLEYCRLLNLIGCHLNLTLGGWAGGEFFVSLLPFASVVNPHT